MTTLTIRAADSAEALEEVMRRLGPDALILSTRQNRGMVEVVASLADARPTPVTPSPAAPALSPRVTPLPAAGGANSFQARLAQAQQQAQAQPVGVAEAQPSAPTSHPSHILPPYLSGRVILVGPPGAGRSLLAARLAAAALRAPGSPRPVLVAPRPDLLTGPGRLAGWARLMGLTLHRPVWTEGLPTRLALPDPATIEIMDLSDMPAPAPEALAPLASLSDSHIWLVLPTGLHPRMHSRICPPWAGIARLIALTRADLCPPTAEDFALQSSTGITPALLADGAGLLDVLRPLAPDGGTPAATAPSDLSDAAASTPPHDPLCKDASDAATHLS